TCSGGGCNGHAGDPCAGGPECNNTCNEAQSNCFAASGATCTTDDANPCTDTLCNGTGTCGRPNTAPCDDGVFSNRADTCSGGACNGHAGDPCASGPECNNPCNEGAMDCLTALNTPCSDDNNACTDDVCDGAGNCHIDNTDPCDDGSPCTLNDTCSGGQC